MNNYLRAIKGVVVDAGHGGADPGAINGNIYEKDFTLAVSKYIYNRLKELGIPTYITRSTDETLNRDERVNRILSAFGNDPNVIVLSNHINAGGGEGAEVVYALRNTDDLAKGILESIGTEGQKMRKYYQRRLPTDPSKDYYFIQRLTGKTQPVLIEYGFIDNSKDLAKLQNNILNYGEAVVRAVADYTNTPYKSPEGLDTNIYVVQKGDTLYDLAIKFNTTVSELKAANNLTSNFLNVGQKIRIPIQPESPQSDEYATYIVEKDDNLYSIAKKFNTTVDKLIEFNQLNTSNLIIGQRLLIPLKSDEIIPVEDYYIVKLGDTLYSIASKYNTTIDDIIKANNLTTTVLQVGDKLIVPNYSSIKEDDTILVNNLTYTVQRGDTLYSIANKFDTTVSQLKSLNNLSTNLLTVGQNLVIPSNSITDTYYVQSGDTLYSIANKFNTTVSNIRRLNNLNSDLLTIGQVIQIPN